MNSVNPCVSARTRQPQNTVTARFKRTTSSSSRRPILLPIFGFGAAVILSIIKLLSSASRCAQWP
jgi:hypothetical protein